MICGVPQPLSYLRFPRSVVRRLYLEELHLSDPSMFSYIAGILTGGMAEGLTTLHIALQYVHTISCRLWAVPTFVLRTVTSRQPPPRAMDSLSPTSSVRPITCDTFPYDREPAPSLTSTPLVNVVSGTLKNGTPTQVSLSRRAASTGLILIDPSLTRWNLSRQHHHERPDSPNSHLRRSRLESRRRRLRPGSPRTTLARRRR